MLRILNLRTMSAVSMIVLLTASGAAAQEPPRAAADEAAVSLSRLSAAAFTQSHAPTPAGPLQEDEKDTHRWDAIKTGVVTGGRNWRSSGWASMRSSIVGRWPRAYPHTIVPRVADDYRLRSGRAGSANFSAAWSDIYDRERRLPFYVCFE